MIAPIRPDSPVQLILDTLAHQYTVPNAALVAAVPRIHEFAPALLAVLNRAAGQGLRQEPDRVLLFRALPILAATRQTAACKPLLRLLRRPEHEIDDTLGDLITETLPQIAASVFDGDANTLFVACADRRISEAARWSLLLAAAFLTWDGRIPHPAMHEFLRRFHTAKLAPRLDCAWLGWTEAIGLLGFEDLAPLVRETLALFPEGPEQTARFHERLADAKLAPHDAERLHAANTGYVEDVLAAFDWTRRIQAYEDGNAEPAPQPIMNPARGLGRNDPCPCGSGRKYKKCCLPAT